MRKLFAAIVLVATSLHAQTKLPANVEQLDTAGGITQYRLKSNDMTILLVPNHTSPVFTFMVVYHVGSRNEAPGNTGSAHLLEHMLFNKSTENFGKAHGHKTFQEVLYEAGADYGSTNMTTWVDRMNGYSTLPSNKLELAMKIEADRLGRGLILDEERQPEMSVVRNEYEIGENNAAQALNKAVTAAAIQAHPYHWSTIGYKSDIEGVSTEKLREHYKNFFWPNNAEAILVGDFDPASALAMFDREFGSFAKSPKPIPQVITVEPPQEGERRAVVRRPGNVGLVQVAYIRPGALHPDFIPLDVLANILGEGVNSRLYQALVDKQLATDVEAENLTLRDPFPLFVQATVAQGVTHEKVEEALKATLYDVAKNGVTDVELARAQKQIEVAVIKGRDGTYPLAQALGESVASANWKWFVNYIDNLKAVTKADVNRVAATYLVPEHATVGWFIPDANAKKANAAQAAAAPASVASAAKPATTDAPSRATAVSSPRSGSFASRTLHRVLPNGITIDIVENHAVPTVAMRGLIFAGDAAAASGREALPQLTSKMLQRGTTSRTKEQIGALLADVGATVNFFTSTTETQFFATGLSRDVALIADVVADELKHPAFAADELVKAKAEVKTDVLRAAENTQTRAVERLTQLVYRPGHPYRAFGKDIMLTSLDAATADELRAFHKARYVGAAMIVAVAGDVDAQKAMALLEKLLGDIPKGTRPSLEQQRTDLAEKGTHEVVTMRGKANMNLIFGHASGLRRGDPDYEAALIANAALGQSSLSSRIGRRVRDTEGLSYNLGSRFTLSDALDGVWLTNVNVAPQNLAKALKSTRDEIEKFAREGVTDEEVDVQKNYFANTFQVGLGSNSGIAQTLITAEKFGFGPKYLDDFPSRIRAVTKEQVNAAVKQHLHPEKMFVVVAGDLDTIPE